MTIEYEILMKKKTTNADGSYVEEQEAVPVELLIEKLKTKLALTEK